LSNNELKEIKRYLKKNNLGHQVAPFIRKVTMGQVRQMNLFDTED